MAVSEQTLMAGQQIDQLSINTIRTLAMDAVQQANSGHPGTPMALAPIAYTLWQQFLRYDPADPTWPNRDRFVLSNGHASMLALCPGTPCGHSRHKRRIRGSRPICHHARRHQKFSSARPQVSRTSRVSRHRRNRNHHRPSRTRRREQRRYGDCQPMARTVFQPS